MVDVRAGPSHDFASRHADGPVVIAHRGASALAPENTLAAIRLAAELGSAAVEFDVHASADGVPVVIHDYTLARTTNGRGMVRNHTQAQLQDFSAGSWFGAEFRTERVPTLAQALSAVGPNMIVCIEIKTGVPIMERIAADVLAAGLEERVVIFSFKPKQLVASKRELPKVPTLLLVDPGPDRTYRYDTIVEKARSVRAELIGLDHAVADGPIVESLQDAGFPVFVYTVNAGTDVKRVVEFGVDGIISNHPRATMSRTLRLRQVLK